MPCWGAGRGDAWTMSCDVMQAVTAQTRGAISITTLAARRDRTRMDGERSSDADGVGMLT
eukprot:54890-Rhodomonas_salina.1